MIDKINNNQVTNILKESSSRQSEPPRSSANSQAGDLLQVSYKSLIESATQPSTDDVDAVKRARELLLSGQLDSPENIRAAAENIVKFGI
jgi:hypothetical protein